MISVSIVTSSPICSKINFFTIYKNFRLSEIFIAYEFTKKVFIAHNAPEQAHYIRFAAVVVADKAHQRSYLNIRRFDSRKVFDVQSPTLIHCSASVLNFSVIAVV